MNVYKKYILLALGIPLPFIALFAINLYLYDPAQIFHKPYFRETTFFPDMRVSARGIIEHYDFDSYILGTSMLENTSAREAKEKLGGEWVNISMSGSTFKERAIVMQYLFGIKQPKQILYSLEYLTNAHNTIRDNMPSKLYDDSKINDFTFYINDRFVLCSLVWNKAKHCVGDKQSNIEESLVRWIEERDFAGKFGGIGNWIKPSLKAVLEYNMQKLQEKSAEKENLPIQAIQEEIVQDILKFVEQNKTTQFHFVIPTFSRLSYKLNCKQGEIPESEAFMRFKEVVSWLVKKLESYPNAKIYGFDTLDYADNIANYNDLTHYNIDMNSMQLDAIRDNTHRLTSENIEEYLRTMELKIQEYDVEPLIKIAKEALGE